MEKGFASADVAIHIGVLSDVMDYIYAGVVSMKLEKILDLKGLNKYKRITKSEKTW
jgi:hypothetical protein